MTLQGSYDTPVIVGRGSQATLNLGKVNKQVSRRHAIVQWCSTSSAFQITVLGQNGVRINGTGFPSGQQATLRGGDIVDLVGVKMVFRTPSGPPPSTASAVEGHHLLQDQGNVVDDKDFESSFNIPTGLVTPKRAQQKTNHFQHGRQNHQLATPTRSSPIRDPLMTSPSPHLTPTARMRHKMQKYDLSSVNRDLFNSPPPSSDGATEFGTSPVPYRSEFTFSVEASSPVRKPNLSGLSSPASEPKNNHNNNIFMDELPPKNPFKALNQQRVPLAPLALNENNQSNESRQLQQQPSGSRVSTSPAPASPLTAKSTNNTTSTLAITTTPIFMKSALVPSSSKSSKAISGAMDSAIDENQVPSTHRGEKLSSTKDLKKPAQESSKQKDSKESSVKSASVVVKTKKPSTDSSNQTKDLERSRQASEQEKTTYKAQKQQQIPSAQIKETTTAVKKEKKSAAIAAVAATTSSEKAEDGEDKNKDSGSSSSETSVKKAPMDYTEMIIDTLVFARKKKSMTLTELFDEMITSQPSLMATQNADEIKEQMLQCLSAARCVGKITRKGKDAYNKPLENQWYYIPEADHNLMRKLTRQEVMPSARKCTLKDKQYFFKMPPKLPYHRKSASPYAVKPTPRRSKDSSKLSVVNDNGDVSSSSSSDPDEDGETDGAALIRKRKSTAGLGDNRKRKGTGASTAMAKSQPDDEDEEDDVLNDSLDDLSELSGLSD
ncbi:hypothetical protein BGX28_008367 [Mortierella sp. GBA30]|nr:hypothetical protein BGX28_008367 [Mortierella sp. GBA30]